MRDSDLSWQRPRAALVLLISVVAGPLVVLGLNWSAFTIYAGQTQPERPSDAARAPASPPTPALPLAAPPSPTQIPTVSPTQRVAVQASATPVQSLTIALTATSTPGATAQSVPPTSTPPPPPTFTATPTPSPSAEQSWAGIQSRLDTTWGVDAAASIALLSDFHDQFPDYQPAREKLYASLVASAAELAGSGAPENAAQVLTRAVALAPERGEGRAALQALTPLPTPEPPTDQEIVAPGGETATPPPYRPQPPPPTPVRSIPRPAPPPVVRVPVPQAPPPTPTKIPFRPPSGP
ncbi:MAG: hypothetical protein ACR2IK_19665 [Chloroflexota bacterium]